MLAPKLSCYMAPDYTTHNPTIKSQLTYFITKPTMYANPNFKAPVYTQNAEMSRTATSNRNMLTTIIIGKDIQSIPMVEMAPTQDTKCKKI